MNNRIKFCLTLSLLLSLAWIIIPTNTHAQTRRGKPVYLRYADSLVGTNNNDDPIRSLYGNVWLSQDGMNLYADFARQFLNSNTSILDGNVRMVRSNMTLTADSAKYRGYLKVIDAQSSVAIVDTSGTVLTADQGRYDINAEIATFQNNVQVENDSIVLIGEKVRYERMTQNTYANTAVVLFYKDLNTVILCDTAEYLPQKKYAYAGGFPILYNIDTLFDEEKNIVEFDTMSVRSSQMQAFDLNRFVFTGFVQIFKQDLSATSDFATFYKEEKLITLSGSPTIWYQDNQITADSIAIFFERSKLKKIYASGRAISMMKNDSVFTKRIDQISGDTIIVEFNEKKIHQISSMGAAKSLYFFGDEKGLFGVDRTSTDAIEVYFEEGKPTKIDWLGQSEKDFIEPFKTINNETTYYLPFFKWNSAPPEESKLRFKCN